jgi:hypothetical protein
MPPYAAEVFTGVEAVLTGEEEAFTGDAEAFTGDADALTGVDCDNTTAVRAPHR